MRVLRHGGGTSELSVRLPQSIEPTDVVVLDLVDTLGEVRERVTMRRQNRAHLSAELAHLVE
ncbi:unannotated protein [freshwater metagenome]|uniref:Unannotated protein n=1 Tax=freshwater metagenome TaxID=449393 RepID=A0A6J7D0P1_9ZZZZ